MSNETKQKNNYILVMILYLAGIFMGAIDTGIVTPARTIIQNELGVSAQNGIWMITIYTLAYAASVPIMGKLADKFGRKYVYIICIFLFGSGSFLCGLSGSIVGFPLLIAARIIQAIGGGGIVPIATAEFGTTFPADKRGMALGLVGGVYGIANVFGASAGSAILDLFGVDNWEFIFYINIPISLFIVICGFFALKNNRDEENNKKIDIFGIFTLTIMVLSLLYGLKNLDFFDFVNSIRTTSVYPFLLIFLVLIPIFILAEKKAEDPVISLTYFTERNIIVTLVLSLISGFLMMGVIFVPQFSENCLKLSTGSGGYLVIILGLFAGFGAPVSGKLIDKFGPKVILAFGFLCTGLGALFMMFVTTKYPSMLTVLIGLALAGLGMGFTMGTPVNYMMLADTDPKQSNSAIATLSLVRSIGTAIAPAIMVGFVANAGMSVQGNLMDLLPKEVKMPEIPYAQELEEKMETMKENPQFADMMEGMPSFSSMGSMNMDMSMSDGNFEMPEGTLEMLQSSDVTTIVENTKKMSEIMFHEMTPDVIEKITNGINKGIEGINSGVDSMKDAKSQMETALEGMSNIPTGMGNDAEMPAGMGDMSEMPAGMG
ncbi:MAG: MFS transporter, partial [Eubacteriales bacterium]|nr:MFS transporter [Eubacteriales bacterium]